MSAMDDAVVVGSGPNGLAAAVELARAGLSVRLLEARDTIGGGLRTTELTLPGFLHDVCSGCHPTGILSPYFRSLPLERHGLRWLQSSISAAHPLDGQPAVLLRQSVAETARELGDDARRYEQLFRPFLGDPHGLLEDLLGPLRIPKHPLLMARFGLPGLFPAATLLRYGFRGERARAMLAGCAAHSILPFESLLTGAVAMIFAFTAHVADWPVAAGGSRAIGDALASYLTELGGRIETSRPVRTLADLPPARVVLFDTSPAQLASIAGPVLPGGYLQRLGRYRYGPGVFKLDWALDASIPWSDPRVREASTVHVGGTLDEIAAAEAAVWRGEHPERPFVMVVQQSELDPSRAPAGKHTGYAYCHVPAGSDVDLTDVVERQIERFAPGFRERILARHVMRTRDLEAENPNYLGGVISGGAMDLAQFFTRPVARLDPYSTPNPRVFLCSASTPPGAGVHGMCGYFAARSALARLRRLPARLEPLHARPA
jgi:phytoene dehydrogenase-like protein